MNDKENQIRDKVEKIFRENKMSDEQVDAVVLLCLSEIREAVDIAAKKMRQPCMN